MNEESMVKEQRINKLSKENVFKTKKVLTRYIFNFIIISL